ncbi:MAG: transglycosylase SLT domain-containing protein [Methylococcaceae bacterium]|nr:transglycosylase SLT domain-containing protein [Methylococcaceae bacterium]
MSAINSISSRNYLLFLIIFITTGCAEKATTHAFLNEVPPVEIELSQLLSQPLPIQSNTLSNTEKPETITYTTAWDRLFSLYALPKIDNDRIEHEVQRYLKHPKYLEKIQRRAAPYLHFIIDEIESKQMPGELALLPVVESAFLPHAYSRSKASGLWQFIPSTGRLFGLKQNWWYDGRRDVYTSTQAATSYLKQLSQTFDGDWFLALASYNAGKGNIRKAIRKNKKKNLATDYWSLPLRRETKNYIPRLLAIAKIFANAEKYNIPLLDIPNKPHFTVVNTESQMDLNLAAEMANTSLDEFFILNPAFKRGSTDPDGPFHLLVHTDKAENFKTELAKTLKKDRIKWRQHQIKSGENLGIIAKKYKTTVNALLKGNHLENTNIRAGKYLLIPSLLASPSKNTGKQLYTVKKGDTFWDIARQFDVRSQDIAQWNNISLNKTLQPGQKLIIKEG